MSHPPIEIQDASVVLGSTLILDSLSLRVDAGESVVVLGANGSGKSTLMKTILGLIPVRTGTVTLFGADVSRRGCVPWTRVGYVPQRLKASSGEPGTALEVVRSGLLDPRHPFADRGRKAREAAMAALDAVGLADRAHDHCEVFSGGQSQRVLIARALVRQPDLLILDEPLAGVDRASRQALPGILTSLRERGLTLVTVLHELGELAPIVERAVVISEGRIVFDGDAGVLCRSHHDDGEQVLLEQELLDGCEHEHLHGDTAPIVHPGPDLSGPLSSRTFHSGQQ